MNKSLEIKLYPLCQLGHTENKISQESLMDLSLIEIQKLDSAKDFSSYLEKTLFWEKNKEKILEYNKSKFRKKYVGQNYCGFYSIENISQKILRNLKILLTFDKVKIGSNDKDVLPIKEFEINQMNTNEIIFFPFMMYLENASYQLNLLIYYFEYFENNLSDLKKYHYPIPLQPVSALNIESFCFVNEISQKTECFFEIELNNVSEKELVIDNLDVKLNKGGVLDMCEIEFVLPSLKNILLNFGESYSSIISLSKELNMFDCQKNITFGFLEVNYSFLDKSNDGGCIELALHKKQEENRFLKLIPVNSNQLSLKNKEIAEFKCLLLNFSNKTLYLRFDKIFRENMPLNIHQINIEGNEKIPDIYEIKSNEFLNLNFLVFPRVKGFFRFNFFKILYVEKRTYNAIEYDSPEIHIF